MEKLRGVVEIDETYVGPKEKGTGLVGVGRVERKKASRRIANEVP